MRRSLFLCSLFVVLRALFAQEYAMAQTIHYVDNLSLCEGRAPCYATIMAAVAAAVASDTIAVFPGIYPEAVVISSRDNIDLRAHKKSLKPVIAAPSGANAVSINSPGVRISGFILEAGEGSAVEGFGGISGFAIIEDNLVQSLNGIRFRPGSYVSVRHNTIVGGGIGFPQGGNGCQIEGNSLIGAGIGFGGGFTEASNNIVRGNVLTGGGIGFSGRDVSGNLVQSNIIEGGYVSLGGRFTENNMIRDNTVRGGVAGGGIHLGFGWVDANTIVLNFVSGSSGAGSWGDGISIMDSYGGGGTNVIRRNTSVGNTGCDINDQSQSNTSMNVWEQNRFVTKCGAATNSQAAERLHFRMDLREERIPLPAPDVTSSRH